jgi:NADPH-dependent 2,4-dienoyl-CoA reductase/sulfur reductase-like enzyme
MIPAEIVVVGAGPAGISAAVEAARAGARVLLIDEGRAVGGQIYRQLAPPLRTGAEDPLDHHRADRGPLLASLADSGVEVWTGVEVWGLFPERVLAVARQGRSERIQAEALVLATGAYDRPVAFPGWTLPGVVTAGGTTALIKSQRVLPGSRMLLAGTGPLLLAAAAALVQGGAHVVGVAVAASRMALLGLLRRPAALGKALDVMATLRRAGVPLWTTHGIVRAEGREAVERAVIAEWDADWRPVPGRERAFDVDTVCLGYGLVPSSELAQLAGCDMAYRAGQGGWVPVSTPEALMATSAPGVFVAGDGAGVAGADAAREAGRLAGLGAARHVGRLGDAEARSGAREPLRNLRRLDSFRAALERIHAPRPGLFELATDETVVCRCEEITARQIREAVSEGARAATEVRAATRCGMGLCQGRMCMPTVTGLVERWTEAPPTRVGRLTARPPVRPLAVTALAGEAGAGDGPPRPGYSADAAPAPTARR